MGLSRVKREYLPWLVCLSGAIFVSASAHADGTPPPAVNTGDTAWMLASSALVMIMTPGLAFFYAGMVRTKNTVATMMQSFIALPVITMLWFAFGYSLAFSKGNGFLGGLDWVFFHGVGGAPNADYGATVPHLLFAVFQCMFAIITPALVTGAFAERMKFKSYLAFLVLWSALIYTPVAHWVWGVGGFLKDMGALDFAGGTAVHMTAGFSALAAALVFGRRVDFGKADTSSHSIPLVVIGTALLWFGWFGFNGGSAIASGELATSAFAVTHLAASSAALTWMILDWILKGKPSLVGACIGAVVGLVAITPASGYVTAGSGVLIGIVGAAVSNLAALMRSKSQLDDSLDVFACHGLGGTVGILMTGLLASKAINSTGAEGGGALFLIQLKAALIVAVFSFVGSFVLFKVIDLLFGLRPSASEETKGLDAGDHGEKAYVN